MSGDRIVEVTAYLMMLSLPLSALIVRRLPLGRTLKLAAIWIVIFTTAALLAAILLRTST